MTHYATCRKCGLTYECQSQAMVKMAMLGHVTSVRRCNVKRPSEIDDMIWEEAEA